MDEHDQQGVDSDAWRRRRLEYRYHRAEIGLAAARATYSTICEMANANDLQIGHARLQVHLAQQRLDDIANAMELTEDRGSVA